MTRIAGVFPVLPTIFDADGRVDREGFARVVDYVIASGADGCVFPGLASEYDELTLDERLDLMALAGELTRGRIAFVAGAGGRSDAESAALALAAKQAGAAALMVVTPHRLDGDEAGLAAFYRYLGSVADTPIMLQNAPRPMGLGLSPDAILRLVEQAPAIRYVKEENMPCGQRITALLDGAKGGLDGVFGGAGGRYITDELARGATGTMPACELAEMHAAMFAAHRAGDEGQVRRLFERMLPVLLMQAVFRWRLTKEVLRRRGLIDSAFVRAAGPAFDAMDHRELTQMLLLLEDLTGPLSHPAAV
ncbi:dihydrodipicolinate synthase family protein [Niveispirillum sp. KHB5.9]|uniref:dihydrodipicolinate synthase family protein n=1 Tax=Niveispirillum sp. KHB5.9 TaxID=3400269 RepID=UPI003A846236